MRDEGPLSGILRRAATLAVLIAGSTLAASALAPDPASAQALRGYTQLQFHRFDPAGTSDDRELWLRTLQLDVAKRFADRYDVSGQVYFNEVSTVGRPDAVRSPRGSLRIAHPEFGTWLSYRPLRTTDGLGLTTRTDELQASGYFARAHLPALSATWTRRTRRVPVVEPRTVSVARNLSASQAVGPLELRAAYFDQTREAIAGVAPADERRNALAGGTLRFGPRRATFLAQYDVTETKRLVAGSLTERSLLHAASLNGTGRLSSRTDAALTYGFRRTMSRNGYRYDLDDHEGSGVVNVAPRRSIRLTGGGGVRTVRDEERRDLQWYLLLLGSIEGRVRPGWTARAGAARSFNWTGRDRARPIDTYQASTSMRLARGLDLNGSGQVSVTDPTGRAQVDSIGRNSRVVSQGALLVTATPLRRITATYSIRGYRSGPGLMRASSSSRSDSWDLRWSPSPTVDFSGSLQSSRGLRRGDPTLRIWRGTGQWTPSRRLELSASYLKSDQARGESDTELPPGRETLGARALLGLSSDFRIQALWTLVDPGTANEGTRLELAATLALRRR
jgi:hypothetical protein